MVSGGDHHRRGHADHVSGSGPTTADAALVATPTRLSGQAGTATDRIIPLSGIDVRV